MRLFIDALWSPAGKELTFWLSFVMSNCEVVTFPFGILGQVWCVIVSNPDICLISYSDRPHVVLSILCKAIKYHKTAKHRSLNCTREALTAEYTFTHLQKVIRTSIWLWHKFGILTNNDDPNALGVLLQHLRVKY